MKHTVLVQRSKKFSFFVEHQRMYCEKNPDKGDHFVSSAVEMHEVAINEIKYWSDRGYESSYSNEVQLSFHLLSLLWN